MAICDEVKSTTKLGSSNMNRPSPWRHGFDWPVLLWIGGVHLFALAAPLFFTWKGVALTLGMGWVFGSLGVCLGYHRLLTHQGFKTYRPIRRLFAWLGALAGEGPPVTWVAMHRKHHQFSDRPGDPHSPHEGPWWSHMLWFLPKPHQPEWGETMRRYAPDLLEDPFMRFLDRTFLVWQFLIGFVLLAVGWSVWDAYTGWSFVFFGVFVRLVYVFHITWLVNSAAHMWGYRNYETSDNSRNLWWVGLLAYGEGWHNNHHAYQRCARHGHRWWELDLTYAVIWILARLGLVWDVVDLRAVGVSKR